MTSSRATVTYNIPHQAEDDKEEEEDVNQQPLSDNAKCSKMHFFLHFLVGAFVSTTIFFLLGVALWKKGYFRSLEKHICNAKDIPNYQMGKCCICRINTLNNILYVSVPIMA